MYLGTDYDVTHYEKLHDLQYLPIKAKSLPEMKIYNFQGVKVNWNAYVFLAT